MLFNSLSYAIFFPLVFSIYWIFPNKYRWIILLMSSYYFYMSWNPKYVVLILGTTLVSYVSGLLLEKSTSKQKKKVLFMTLLVCIGVLFIFKYLNFALETIYSCLSLFSINISPWTLKLLLPVGISFYTFQTVSYVIDIYNGRVSAEKNLGIYATYISFFPQLVAGPIERTSNLLPQIKNEKQFSYEKAMLGIKIMLWGYFKKMVIADFVAQYVDIVFNDVHAYEGIDLLIAVFFFTIQIYCDFSGYSSIAIGSAKLLGIDLTENFKSPYFSISIKEFWSRWHISLSTWFRDYIYIPLGGNRKGRLIKFRNILITFLISGLWHGASWMFFIWGGIHGIAQIIEDIFKYPLEIIKKTKFGKAVLCFLTFVFCNFAWIFFRAESFPDAIYIVTHLKINSLLLSFPFIDNNLNMLKMCYILFMIALLSIVDCMNYHEQILIKIKKLNPIVQNILWIAVFISVIIFAQKGEVAEFVYFQF